MTQLRLIIKIKRVNIRKYSALASKAFPSLITFFLGVGALYLADVFITRGASVEEIAEWATLKSFMMVCGTFTLFGLDQQLIREPQASKLIAKVSIFQILIIASLAGLLGYRLGFTPSYSVGALAVAGIAFSIMAFSWWRTNLQMTAAYLSNGTWRLSFLIGIIFLSHQFSISTILIGAFGIGLLVIAGLFIRMKPRADLSSIHRDINNIRDIYIIGSSYFMAALSLSIAAYGEHLVVRGLGTNSDVALYFNSAVLYLFPGVMFNQYVAAVVGPALRQDEGRAVTLIRKYYKWTPVAILVIWPGLMIAGSILGTLIYGEIKTPFLLMAILSFTACVRLLYIVPSSFVGITAKKKQLRNICALFLAIAIFMPFMAWGFVKLGVAVIIAVAVANLINWSLRTLVGLSIVRQRFAIYSLQS